MSFSFGLSFCPNDTYLFYALIHGKTQLKGVEPFMADVEELNRKAQEGALCATKISAAVLPKLRDNYLLLDAGAAFGREEAPVVVAKNKLSPDKVKKLAVPGIKTTAYLLYRRFFGTPEEVVELRYDMVMDAVASGRADAGILIHEGRFVYQDRGLELVADLGELWRRETGGLPVPLGLIVLRKDWSHIKSALEDAIRESLLYAKTHPQEVFPFVKKHAQEMSESVIKKHIEAFVNELTPSMGEEGKMALELLLGRL